MAIEVTQIIGDTVELVFNPAEENVHVGESLSIRARHEDRALIVQIIEIQTIFSASWWLGRDRRASLGPPIAASHVAQPQTRAPRRRTMPQPPPDPHGFSLAIAKIRSMVHPTWGPWDGWLPTHAPVVTRIADDEIVRRGLPDPRNPLWLGETSAGEPLQIDQAALGALNLIAGVEGARTAHFAAALMSRFLGQGLPCLVFDTKGVYSQLLHAQVHPSTAEDSGQTIITLVVGESLKLAIADVSPQTLSTLLRRFGLPAAVALYFTSHVGRRFGGLKRQAEVSPSPPFLGIDDLLQLARDLEAEGHAVEAGAILSCLEAIKHTRIFATLPHEATAWHDGYAEMRQGNALVLDLSQLTPCVRTSVVSALIDSLRGLMVADRQPAADRLACLFFDEAEAIGGRDFVADMLLSLRPLGLTSFCITTKVRGIEGRLQHDIDNLFLCQAGSDAARHLAQCSRVDAATLRKVGRHLRSHDALLVGKTTGEYPIIFALEPPDGFDISAENSVFSPLPETSRRPPGTRLRPRFARRVPAPAAGAPSLPLFPEELSKSAASGERRDNTQVPSRATPAPPTLEQMSEVWDRIVRRVARRRRILETILAAARPLRVTERGLTLSFPPQQRFQQELVESDEYRGLIEEEIRKVFGVSLEVSTEVEPL